MKLGTVFALCVTHNTEEITNLSHKKILKNHHSVHYFLHIYKGLEQETECSGTFSNK